MDVYGVVLPTEKKKDQTLQAAAGSGLPARVPKNPPRGTLRFPVTKLTFSAFQTPSGNINGVAMGCHGASSPGLTVTWPCLHNKTWLPCS